MVGISTQSSDANPVLIDDPDMRGHWIESQRLPDAADSCELRAFRLIVETQKNESLRRILFRFSRVGEVEISRHNHASFGCAYIGNLIIGSSGHTLFEDGHCIVASAAQACRAIGVEIFVDLEFHAVFTWGRATISSCANQAA